MKVYAVLITIVVLIFIGFRFLDERECKRLRAKFGEGRCACPPYHPCHLVLPDGTTRELP